MGVTFGPDYANLFVGYLERKYVYNNNLFSTNIVFYQHYIDNIFVIFNGREAEFLIFLTIEHVSIFCLCY